METRLQGRRGVVLRGATLVDGTGSPRVSGTDATVRIDGDTISAVGEAAAVDRWPDDEVVDLDGLVLAPGFVDVHTHYDAQVLWDPDLTPSCWHGVTTVVIGNCGFGIAPTRPADRDTMARILENVEGMSVEALRAGIRWDFETFPEYLDVIDGLPLRLNVAALLGHTPVRQYVMGDDASEREATADEVDRMCAIVTEGMRAGAAGFASSQLITHVGDAGKPVPSRLAGAGEVRRLCDAVGAHGSGVLMTTIGAPLDFEDFAAIAASTGRPLIWNSLLTRKGADGQALALLERPGAATGGVWPQIACRPLVFSFNLADPFPVGALPVFAEVLERAHADRATLYADAGWRERARPQMEAAWSGRWGDAIVDESPTRPEAVGRSLADLANADGKRPFDVLVDISLADGLQTRIRFVLVNDDEDEIAALLADDRTVLGLSDAGAHASQLCDACFSTHLLARFVRERGDLTLERAVWHLTGHPAALYELDGRGVVRPGAKADLVAFDPATVAPAALDRVWDLPAGADRLIAGSEGVEHVWVGGVRIRRDGEDVDPEMPAGRLLRGGV
ncbi:MAG: amidohydrolase family protein [Acidimicrobiia bacterium]|nr:amidohydrolase family protein [Acidimicrobiia bacterium]